MNDDLTQKNLLGLITDEERILIERLTEEMPLKGAIVEAGSFFGASTKAFVEGLKRNKSLTTGEKQGRIHAFDKFEYGHWVHPRFIPRGVLQKGDSFLSYFEENLSADMDYVTLHIGDVIEAPQWEGGSIDILFLDICKTPKINDAVQDLFFPHLKPGSLLIQQDYIASTLNIWLYAAMKRLEHCFVRKEHCSVNSVVYECIQTPNTEDLQNASACLMSHSERIDLSQQVLEEWEEIDYRAAEQIQYAILHYRKAVAMNRYGIRPVKAEDEPIERTDFAPNLPF